MASVYDFKMNDIRGQEKRLADYKGQVLLMVNVASKCGLTPQYEGLQALFDKYKDRGLVVLGFPANDFGAQEPGTEAEISQFCESRFHVSFPMFAKISVKGDAIHPLYKYLTKESAQTGEIKWNFQKFLVDRQGQVIANIDPKTEPRDLEEKIEALLG